MAKAKTKPGEEPEQGFLPDMAPVRNDRIHRAARRYRSLMLARKAALAEEVEAQDNLLRIMKEEGVEHYEYGNLSVHLDSKEKVTVKETSHKPEEDNGDE